MATLGTSGKMAVEFVYWGDFELTSMLSREENRGRHWFWFGREALTIDWFRQKLEVAISNAGDRYTPELNVSLPISEHFHELGRTPAFHSRLNDHYKELREASRHFAIRRVSEEAKSDAIRAEALVQRISELLDGVLVPLHENPRVGPGNRVPSEEIVRLANDLYAALDEASDRLRRKAFQQDRDAGPDARQREGIRKIEDDAYNCSMLASSARKLGSFCGGGDPMLANTAALLMVGDAGQGKTHVLCDVAERDVREVRPRILFHGSHFRDAEPLGQMVSLLGLTCTPDEFLVALESAAQAYGCRILILIDALNEGDGSRLWKKFLGGVITEIARSTWLGIAVSVRSTYESVVVPEHLHASQLKRVVHHGFQEHEFEAVRRFFAHFGIQPTIPLLLPEFTNPLFLKILCRSLKAKGLTKVPVGEARGHGHPQRVP